MVTCSRAMTAPGGSGALDTRRGPLRRPLVVRLVATGRDHRTGLQREITILALLVRLMRRGTSGKGATGVKTLVTCTATVLPGLLSGFHVTWTSTGTPTVLLWTKAVMSASEARRPLEAPRTTA